jgi:Domain of Unknown Function (DUF1080)
MKPIRQGIVASVFCIFSTLLFITPIHAQSSDGFISLIDGVSLNGWNIVGDANWVIGKGIIEGNKPTGFLLSTNSYKNFIIRAEFWAESNTNSGIFIRIQDPKKIAAASAYEVNIWDTRPGQEYATGAIVDVAKVNPIHKAGGRWNTMEIVANGSQLKVSMNGVVTSEANNSKFSEGPIALQSAGGVIKFRKLEIKPI